MNNSISFTAKNPTIRFADDIAKRVNKYYPMVSSSKISWFNNADKFETLYKRYEKKIENIRDMQNYYFRLDNGFKEALQLFTLPIKKMKVGNCGEAAILSEIAARANSIRDCFHAKVSTKSGNDFDHAVLLVKNNNKPYIIDSWLGFADYIPRVIEKYKSEYSQYFVGLNEEKIKFIPIEGCATYIFTKMFPNYSEKNLKNLYPELVIKKRGS